jgi:hypothetical protein
VIGVSLEALIILFAVFVDGLTLEALHTTTRFSGRLSLLTFSLILLLQNKRGAANWISGKPYLLFATLHGIHLAELLAFVYLSGIQLVPVRLLGGFVAYVMIFAMPFFASKRNSAKLPAKKYDRIEIIFLSYVWLIFFLTYLPRVLRTLPNVGGTFGEHVILFLFVVLLGLVKTVRAFRYTRQS